jgi:hypothetical protein
LEDAHIESIGDPLPWRRIIPGRCMTSDDGYINLRKVKLPKGWGIFYVLESFDKGGQECRGFIIDEHYRAYVHFKYLTREYRSGIYPVFESTSKYHLDEYLQFNPSTLVFYNGWYLAVSHLGRPRGLDNQYYSAIGLDGKAIEELLNKSKTECAIGREGVAPHTPNMTSVAWHSTARIYGNLRGRIALPLWNSEIDRNSEHVRACMSVTGETTSTTNTVSALTMQSVIGEFERVIKTIASTGTSPILNESGSSTSDDSTAVAKSLFDLKISVPTAVGITSTDALKTSVPSAVDVTSVETLNGIDIDSKNNTALHTPPPQYFDEDGQLKQDPLKHVTENTGELDLLASQLLPSVLVGICIADPNQTGKAVKTLVQRLSEAGITVARNLHHVELDESIVIELRTIAAQAAAEAAAADINQREAYIVNAANAAIICIKKCREHRRIPNEMVAFYVKLYASVFAAVEKFLTKLNESRVTTTTTSTTSTTTTSTTAVASTSADVDMLK